MFDTLWRLDRPQQEVTHRGVAAHGQIELADGFTLKSITAYRKDKSTTPIDFDALPAVDVDVPAIYKNKQFSQEVPAAVDTRPAGGRGRRLLSRTPTPTTIFDVRLFTTFTASQPSRDGDVDTKTWAVFGDFTYDINDQFAVSAGGRYTSDKRHATVFRQSYLGGGSPIFGGLGIPFATGVTDFQFRRQAHRHGIHAARFGQLQAQRRSSSSTPAGRRASKAAASIRAASRPRRPTSTATAIVDADEIFDYMTFDPEKVTSYELGWKGSLFDNRVFAGLALFHANYKDMQIPASVPCVVRAASPASAA